jgi:hypothetical protein
MENPILSELNEQNRVAQNSISPAANRISNRASAKVVALLAALAGISNVSCGGKVEVNEEIIVVEAPDAQAPDAQVVCDPIPNCPAVPVSIYNSNPPDENFYFETDRWYRINPETKEVIVVCEPIHKQECQEGQDPQKDKCSIPVCKDAKTCDPIPSMAGKNQPWRMPYQANLPSNSDFSHYNPFEFDDAGRYPMIFDNVSDCPNGVFPESETYYTCDILPTCEKTIPYCDPIPRCQPGQSPISCEDSPTMQRYSYKGTCQEDYNNIVSWLARQGINPDPITLNADLCEEKYDSANNEKYYQMPLITIDCRNISECTDGEVPVKKSVDINLHCGKWYTGTETYDYSLSCDPIKSCKK